MPTRFVVISALVHVSVMLQLVLMPSYWLSGFVLLVLNHLVIAAVSLWPRSTWLGPNVVRLPEAAALRGEIAITIDDGPDPEVTPQVLAILSKYQVRATFFCIGERVLAHPEICRDIVAAGHDIENHGQFHRNHASLFGPQGWLREVGMAQSAIEATTGRRPRFFRALAGLRNPFLDPVLHRLDVRLVTWTRRGFDTCRADPQRVLGSLLRHLRAGDILLLHDGHSARMNDGRAVILDVLPCLLEELKIRNLTTATLSSVCMPH